MMHMRAYIYMYIYIHTYIFIWHHRTLIDWILGIMLVTVGQGHNSAIISFLFIDI